MMDSRAGIRAMDWEDTKVGDAYLFEKFKDRAKRGAQSYAFGMPRFSDIVDCDDDACYNSGAGYTNQTCYKPNTSLKRRPRARDAVTVQSHVKSIKPIRKQNDWMEIWDLGHALAFEMLRLALLVLLLIMRLGAVWARHFKTWLDARGLQKGFRRCEGGAEDSNATGTLAKTTSEADLIVDSIESCKLGTETTDRELDISDNVSDSILDDISDFTNPSAESTGRTNCAKLTDVRKHCMSGSKGLQLYRNLLVQALKQEHGPGPPNTS